MNGEPTEVQQQYRLHHVNEVSRICINCGFIVLADAAKTHSLEKWEASPYNCEKIKPRAKTLKFVSDGS